ncbi:hypothetical protein K458DRAFT_485529 [Lentithecium fluviatile CBS 122367]|uniref:C2H2-type domain-containing protein n=1 Tax=Lentithecium fluviatile CBS 122367 TaxID=1168545 RepID=A0A6G1JAU5_9PLEO|nr:hypothetical protein K458DRAFT_485529 [Lentithecium fluviatile CBS 122367]
MPPRNKPLPNAINIFNCSICDKGYSRQVDYENHLRSYDHTHRVNLAEMKKLTAANANDNSRPSKAPIDMRSISIDNKPGLPKGFTKIAGAASAGGGKFTKVGTTVSSGGAAAAVKVGEKVELKAGDEKVGEKVNMKADDDKVDEKVNTKSDDEKLVEKVGEIVNEETKKDAEDVANADQMVTYVKSLEQDDSTDAEEITWEQYDVTKPTGCDHANCPGCNFTCSYDEDGWVIFDSIQRAQPIP